MKIERMSVLQLTAEVDLKEFLLNLSSCREVRFPVYDKVVNIFCILKRLTIEINQHRKNTSEMERCLTYEDLCDFLSRWWYGDYDSIWDLIQTEVEIDRKMTTSSKRLCEFLVLRIRQHV